MVEGTPRRVARLALLGALAAALLATATMMIPQAAAQTPQGTVRIMPPISPVSVQDGDFSVFIVVEDLAHFGAAGENFTSEGLGAFELALEYDPAILDVVGAEKGPALAASSRSFQCLPARQERPGNFRFACVSPGREPGPQGTMTLARVTLHPLKGGSSPLFLQATLSGPLGESAVVAVKSGVAQVKGNPSAPDNAANATATRLASAGRTGTPAARTTPLPATGAGNVAGTPGQTDGASADTGEQVRAGQRPSDGQQTEGEADSTPGRAAGALSGATLWFVVLAGSAITLAAVSLAAALWRRRSGAL